MSMINTSLQYILPDLPLTVYFLPLPRAFSSTVNVTLKPKQTSLNVAISLGFGACITELRPGPLMDTRQISLDDRILRYLSRCHSLSSLFAF